MLIAFSIGIRFVPKNPIYNHISAKYLTEWNNTAVSVYGDNLSSAVKLPSVIPYQESHQF
jgi:hypothetical protein